MKTNTSIYKNLIIYVCNMTICKFIFYINIGAIVLIFIIGLFFI